MSIDFQELRELLAAIAQTDITELTLKSDDFELTVRKDRPAPGLVVPPTAVPSLPVALTEVVVSPAPGPTPPVSPAPAAPPSNDKKYVEITSPMVGTFYRAPGPDEAPFVAVGDRIRNGQTVCIIEAMKLMNEIEAEVTGTITEILVENAQPVEYGQVLMRVSPD